MAAITQNGAGVYSLGGTSVGTGVRVIDDTASGTTHFSGNVTISEPTYLICQRLNPQANYVLTVNAPLYVRFTNGLTALGSANDGTLSGNGATSTVIVNQDQGGLIVWECTNSAVNGWGAREAMASNTVIDNQRFVSFGDNGQWFINVDGIGAVQLSGFEFIQTVFNSPNVNNNFNGFSFDGTRRNHLNGHYTVRYQSQTSDRNIIYNSIFAGSDYTTTSGDGKTVHYQFNGAIPAANVLYSVNNLYENSNILISGASNNNFDSPVIEGFSFNLEPIEFNASGVATPITDAVVTGLPAGTTGVQATRDVSTFLSVASADGLVDTNGYFVEVDNGVADTSTNAKTIIKALDWSTDGSLNIVTAFQPSLRLYSYTHNMDNQSSTVTEANAFDVDSSGAVSFVSRTREIGIADAALNSVAYADANNVATTADQLYPQVKRHWYDNRFVEDYEPTIVNGVLTTDKTMILGSSIAYSSGILSLNCGASIAATANVTGLSGTSITIDGTGFSGITINGATTGNFGALTNGANIITSSTASTTVASLDGSSMASAGSLVISGTSVGSTVSSPTITPGGAISTSEIITNSLSVSGLSIFGDATDATSKSNTYTALAGAVVDMNFSGGLTDGEVLPVERLIGNGFTVTDGDFVRINADVDITIETTNTTQILGSIGTGTVTVVEPTIDATFTHEPSSTGGSFAVFERDSATDTTWTQVQTTQRTTTSALASITVQNPDKQYISLWKPKDNVSYTRVSYYDRLSGITEAETNTASTLNIVAEVLSSNDLPVDTDTIDPATGVNGLFEFVWEEGDGVLAGQLTATIKGTDGSRLTNQETQAAMRSLLVEDFYFDTIVSDVTGTASLLPTDVTAGGRADFMTMVSATQTSANGDFIELLSEDGNQQKITALDNASRDGTPVTGMLEAVITGSDADGAGISFPAVDIAVNPAGISVSAVASAVGLGTTDVRANQAVLAANQVNLQVATQRGAVKAASYSAGAIDTDLIQ